MTKPTEPPFELGDVAATAARYAERTAGLERDLETLRAMFDDVHCGQHANREAQLQALASARYALDEQIAERKRFHAQWMPFVPSPEAGR